MLSSVSEMAHDEELRRLKGRRARLELTPAGGGGELSGRIDNCLESADGLVVYLSDDSGRGHTVHHQHIAQVTPLGD